MSDAEIETLFDMGKAGTALPEPVTLSILAIGGALGLLRRRRYLHDLYMIGGNSTADNNPSAGRPNPRKLNIYVEHAERIFRCPSDQGAVNVQSQTAEDQVPLYDRPDWTGTGSMGSSYMYNASPGWYGPDHILSGRRIYEFKNPSRQVVIGDATMLRTWHDLPSKHTGVPLADDPRSTGERILDYDARSNVLIEGVTFKDGPMWTIHWIGFGVAAENPRVPASAGSGWSVLTTVGMKYWLIVRTRN